MDKEGYNWINSLYDRVQLYFINFEFIILISDVNEIELYSVIQGVYPIIPFFVHIL